GALMIREGPRRRATASETGDWVHVDLYLAKTLDYRALLFTGSRWDGQALEWLGRRDATIVAVGGEVSGAVATIRYPGDDDPDVARYTEVLVPELVAAAGWQPARWRGAGRSGGRRGASQPADSPAPRLARVSPRGRSSGWSSAPSSPRNASP